MNKLAEVSPEGFLPRLNNYIPHTPTVKQAAFLWFTCLEVFYGGAAGGGKSDALLMGALQFVDIPDYAALVLRRSYADLSLPGALMDRANEWLAGTDAVWNSTEKTWRFPSGATLTFGYLEYENDKYRYQSAEFQYIAFDELTQFSESQYRYLFSRLRRLEGELVPLRMRSASNPGGVGHDWVKRRFIDGQDGRVFIPARLEDNPFLDQVEYERSLSQLDPITRAQIREGDWSARQTGKKFKREWFKIVEDYPAMVEKVRYWDLAATEPKPGKDPDWTAGALLAEQDGIYYLLDMHRIQARPKGVEDLISQTAWIDGPNIRIFMEQEPGASGQALIDHYARNVLKGFAFWPNKVTGSKELRANPVSSAAEAGNICLLKGSWNNDFLDEIEAFPTDGIHDDQVDALSGAFEKLHVAEPRILSLEP